jgi:FkbM family methyltransferase
MAIDRYETGTTRLLEQAIQPGMVVIDIGAHVGYFSLLAARRVGPQGKVYSFEPDPTNYRLLRENIDANGYLNITATQKAVSKALGSARLMLSSQDNGTHSLYGQDGGDAGIVIVDLVSLDGFLEDEGWPKVDLIKMDIEGAEMDALEGMSRLLQESHGLKLVVEFNPALLRDASVDPLEFLAKPVELGFKVSVIDGQEGTTHLDQANASSFTSALLKSKSSVNLYCLKQ